MVTWQTPTQCGFEPATLRLRVSCSTEWASRAEAEAKAHLPRLQYSVWVNTWTSIFWKYKVQLADCRGKKMATGKYFNMWFDLALTVWVYTTYFSLFILVMLWNFSLVCPDIYSWEMEMNKTRSKCTFSNLALAEPLPFILQKLSSTDWLEFSVLRMVLTRY